MRKGKGIFRTDHRGFSLVELIIVISIMAVLTGILVPAFLKHVEESRVQQDRAVFYNMYESFTYEYAFRGYIPQTLLTDGLGLSGTAAQMDILNYEGCMVIEVQSDGTMLLSRSAHQHIAPGDYIYSALAGAGIDADAIANGERVKVFKSRALRDAIKGRGKDYLNIMFRVDANDGSALWLGSQAHKANAGANKGKLTTICAPDSRFVFGNAVYVN